MTRLRSARFPGLALAACLATLPGLAGCESQFKMAATPAMAPVGQEAAVRALLAPGAAGTMVTIDNPGALPAGVREARNLEVAIGGATIPVTRNPGGYYTFVVPAQSRMEPDVAGNWKVVFVMDDRASQIVTLSTGSPVQFSNPPVLTEPAPGFIVRGLDLKLRANTPASTDKYQFTWAYSTTGQPPWMPIPGQGKEVEWTPPQPGNFFIKVDAIDRATQQAYSTTTPSALVFVTDGDDVITTLPASGSVERGQPVSLAFNKPAGLKDGDLTYAWSFGPSAQGPWSVVQGTGAKVDWLPVGVGSFYVKTEVSNKATGDVNTFITPEAAVFVNEGRPIVTADPASVLRGDRVGLTLNLPVATNATVTWYQSRTGNAAGAAWVPIIGGGKTNAFVVNEGGSYHFRVDVPDAAGAIKTFTTTEPVLTVSEGATPLLQSDPPNAVITKGSAVTLKLNARGVDEVNYKYVWYVSTSPFAGWTALPIESAADQAKKTFNWRTETRTSFGGVQMPAGSYFVRVDASEKNGPNTYTFTSASPVVTIQNN